MTDLAIAAERISKVYRIGVAEQQHESIVGAAKAALSYPLHNFRKLYRLDTSKMVRGSCEDEGSDDLVWALNDVSFEVRRGEILGIIGRNGAGKSTLLKILSRVTTPTSGRVVMNGRVSSLLEVGTGFHPELSGRDNIFLNGTILGMTRKEISRKFGEIVEFSGVERFLDTPVKRYSSGMKVRLAFAVAAHLEPEVLIIDEVLAVGDADFQRKCLEKMHEVSSGEGRTVLFVSHNMGSVAELCDRCIMLEQGTVTDEGEPDRVITNYLKRSSVDKGDIDLRKWEGPRDGDGPLRFSRLSMIDGEDRCCNTIAHRERLRFRIAIDGPTHIPFGVSFGIKTSSNQLLVQFSSLRDATSLIKDRGDELMIELDAGENLFSDGDYYITMRLNDQDGRLMDRVNDCLQFYVNSQATERARLNKGLIRLQGRWTPLTNAEQSDSFPSVGSRS